MERGLIPMDTNITCRRIIDLREKRDWSQTKLASELGISKSTMSKIENGSRKLSTEELDKLSDIFNVTADYLLGRSDYPLNHHKNIQYDLELLLSSEAKLTYSDEYVISEEEKKFFNDIIAGHFQLSDKKE